MRGEEVPLSFCSAKNKGEKGNLADNDSSLREAAVASMAEIFLAGACDMGRPISRRESGRPVLRMTRKPLPPINFTPSSNRR